MTSYLSIVKQFLVCWSNCFWFSGSCNNYRLLLSMYVNKYVEGLLILIVLLLFSNAPAVLTFTPFVQHTLKHADIPNMYTQRHTHTYTFKHSDNKRLHIHINMYTHSRISTYIHSYMLAHTHHIITYEHVLTRHEIRNFSPWKPRNRTNFSFIERSISEE